jgi:hypothetical protein
MTCTYVVKVAVESAKSILKAQCCGSVGILREAGSSYSCWSAQGINTIKVNVVDSILESHTHLRPLACWYLCQGKIDYIGHDFALVCLRKQETDIGQ